MVISLVALTALPCIADSSGDSPPPKQTTAKEPVQNIPGVLFDRRREVWLRINFAKSQGMNVNSQEKSLQELEHSVIV
jgi:hypothetical protein